MTFPTNIQLKNVKHSAMASEETDCFSATVYIDGVNAGTVKNSGYGGPNSYNPDALCLRLQSIAKSLPPMEFNGMTLEHDADTLIGHYFEFSQLEKRLKTLLKTNVVFIGTNDQCFKVKRDPSILASYSPDQLEAFKQRQQVSKILNLLPLGEAVELYMKHAR